MLLAEQRPRPSPKPKTAEARQKASPLVHVIRTAQRQAAFATEGQCQTPGSFGCGGYVRSTIGARHNWSSRG